MLYYNKDLHRNTGEQKEFPGVKFENLTCIKKKNKDSYPLTVFQYPYYDLDSGSFPLSTGYNTAEIVIPYEYNHAQENLIKDLWQKLAARHEILFTRLVIHKDQIYQSVSSKYEAVINFRDQSYTDEMLLKEITEPYNLFTPPFFRIFIHSRQGSSYSLFLNIHPIIGDDTTLRIIINDFVYLFFSGKISNIINPIKEYAYCRDLKFLKDIVNEKTMYWKTKYSEGICGFNFPVDYPVANNTDSGFDFFEFDFDRTSWLEINRVTENLDIPADLFLFAVFNILLYHYTNQEKITVGFPVNNRDTSILPHTTGNFTSLLPIQTVFNDTDSLKEFARGFKQMFYEGLSNSEYNFTKFFEHVMHEADMPVIPAYFKVNLMSDYKFKLQNFDVRMHHRPYHTKSIISMEVYLEDGHVKGLIWYKESLFDPGTIKRISLHYKKIINAFDESPGNRIGEIKLLSPCDSELLNRFNSNQSLYPCEKTIHEIFEEQVKKTPGRVALVFEKSKMTYDELNKKANSLAAVLRYSGIVQGDRIALMIDKSLEMVCGVLAVIKSGGVITPVDPEYPIERINYMLADSCARILLSRAILLEKMKPDFNGKIIDIDDPLNFSAETSDLININTPDDLLYLIYTSGTTGNPKGVMIKHQNIVNLLYYQYKHTNINFEERKTAQFAAFSFDVCFQEIFSTLLAGGELHIISAAIRKDVDSFFNYLKEQEMDILFLPTAYLKFIANYDHYMEILPECLDHIITAGEQLIVSDLLKKTLKEKKIWLHNHYGPSETHVVTALTMPYDEPIPTIPSIGKPISNTNIYILNKQNHLLPPGLIGELCIGGDNVGLGYFNREELTNDKFTPDPFLPGKKMYRTGDLARWNVLGNIEFLGRIDHQIKIRGFRIEPAEIETVIKEFPGIKNCIVMSKKLHGDNNQLAAYIMVNDSQSNNGSFCVNELNNWLNKKLPAYMIPSLYFKTDSIPLTPNGKIDRKRLDGISSRIEFNEVKVDLSGDTEKRLALLWQEILCFNQFIGGNTNFFELGGDSLKLTLLKNRIEKEFQVSLSYSSVYECRTIRLMARCIDRAEQGKQVVEIAPAPSMDYYPLSSAQKRMYIVNQLNSSATTYNETFIFSITGNLDKNRFESAFTELINRHESLRTGFEIINDQIYQKIYPAIDFSILYLEVSEERIDHVIKLFKLPYVLDKPPLFRAGLIKVSLNRYYFILDIHHIIIDGTSIAVMMYELSELYNRHVLPRLYIQYKDYAVWQAVHMNESEAAKQQEFWTSQFKEDAGVLNLPLDFPRPAIKNFEGSHYVYKATPLLYSKINEFLGKNDCTLYMFLLSAYVILLYRYTNQEVIEVGSGIANRNHPGLEKIIGMFVNMIVIRNMINGNNDYLSFLNHVKEQCLSAFENQDFQFDVLVDKVKQERDPSRNPLFDVAFIVQNTDMPDLAFEDLEIAPYELDLNKTSKFDMTLEVIEKKGLMEFCIEYCTALFKEETIKRMTGHFINIIEEIIGNPSIKISEIEMMDKDEKTVVMSAFNDNHLDYSSDKTIAQVFKQQVDCAGSNIAVVHRQKALSYRELDQKANQLANFLINRLSVKPGDLIGVVMEHSLELIIALLGILKAGAAFIPMDVKIPEKRIKEIIDDSSMRTLIFLKKEIRKMNRLQWECESLENIICLDSYDVKNEDESEKNILMNASLWHFVGDNTTSQIAGGGWKSSYTGLDLSLLEMEEYSNNAFKKLIHYINKNTRVLEIGCASGITMFNLAQYAGFYYGTDLSEVIIKKDQEIIDSRNITNIKLKTMAAHEIDTIEVGDFDIIIMNSVIQCFHGHNYLRKVIRKAVNLLKDKGLIFIGDIMDQDLKQDLYNSLVEYKNNHPSCKTKTDLDSELFISRNFFKDLSREISEILGVSFSQKIYTVKNELTEYRYDLNIHINKKKESGLSDIKLFRTQFDLNQIEKEKNIEPVSKANSRDLAYIIYTSGSTGKPKGVLIENRSVLNLCAWHNTLFNITEKDRGSKYTSIGFDASIYEIFPYLTAGASIYMVDEEIKLDPLQMKEFFEENKITVAFLPTQVCEEFMKYDFKSLRIVHTGGDKLKKFIKKDYRLINNYGPTETTVISTAVEITKQESNFPIGKPVANNSIYILSPYNKLQPIGVPGELCVSGDSISRGYLNREKLTNEKFVENPFVPGERMYRTGDLSRWLSNGNVEWLGRIDSQVKIRGVRIELGEIENRVLKHPDIENAAVIDRLDENNERYLCAYYTADKEIEISDLRDFLSKELPGYMIPTHFMRLNSLPTNTSGKVDKKNLPEPVISEVSNTQYEAPGNSVEEKLVELWAAVLDQKRISVKANFFDLGGHSLKLTVLAEKIRNQFNADIPLVKLFQSPTISELAAYIISNDDSNSKINDPGMILMRKGLITGENIFFIHTGDGRINCYIEMVKSINPRFYCYGLQASPLTGLGPMEIDIKEMAASYIKKIKMIQPEGPYSIMGFCIGGAIAYEMVHQLELNNEEVIILAMINTDFSKESLWKDEAVITVSSEYNYLRRNITDHPALFMQLDKCRTTDELWSSFIEYTEQTENGIQLMRNLIPPLPSRLRPDFNNLTAKELAKFWNMCRTLDKSRSFYNPHGNIINTKIDFFIPEQIIAADIHEWMECSVKQSCCHYVKGDHFSLLEMPIILSVTDIFNNILKKRLMED